MITQVKKPKIYLFKRKTEKRESCRRMRVIHTQTVTAEVGTIIDHYELSVPGYKLTSNGPELIGLNSEQVADNEE